MSSRLCGGALRDDTKNGCEGVTTLKTAAKETMQYQALTDLGSEH